MATLRESALKGVEGHRPTDALQATISSEEQIRDMVLAAYGVPKGVFAGRVSGDTPGPHFNIRGVDEWRRYGNLH